MEYKVVYSGCNFLGLTISDATAHCVQQIAAAGLTDSISRIEVQKRKLGNTADSLSIPK